MGHPHGKPLRIASFVRIFPFQRLIFLFQIHPEKHPHQHNRTDNSDHTQRIGNGISQRNRRVFHPGSIHVSLLRGSQSRGIRHGSGQDSNHRRDRQSRDNMNNIGSDNTRR